MNKFRIRSIKLRSGKKMLPFPVLDLENEENINNDNNRRLYKKAAEKAIKLIKNR